MALCRWPTTIGGWKTIERSDGSMALKYEESITGDAIWPEVLATRNFRGRRASKRLVTQRRTHMKSILIAALLGCLALSTGCLYANVNMPLSYRAPTPSDVTGRQTGPEVQGESCNYIVLWLVAWGDGGYSAAVANAKAKSGAQMLSDVKADTKLLNVLSLFQRSCTQVTGNAVK